MITGLGHLAFTVSDMEKSKDFYVNGLGFVHAFTLKDGDGNPWIEYFKVTDGQFIELFYAKDGFEPKNGSYQHLCLEVDDCEATAKELEKRGLTLIHQPRQGMDGNTQAWVADPDGNRIELMQISPTSPQAYA